MTRTPEPAPQDSAEIVERCARIIAPRAFRTVQERRSDMDAWVSRIDSHGLAFDAGAEATRLAQDNYDADSADRDDAYAKAGFIAAAIRAWLLRYKERFDDD